MGGGDRKCLSVCICLSCLSEILSVQLNWDQEEEAAGGGALTGDVVQAGRHAAPLEEGVRVGVHHQQPGHAPAGLDGGHHLRVRLPLHGHGVHLGREIDSKSSRCNPPVVTIFPHSTGRFSSFPRRDPSFFFFSQPLVGISFFNIITESARGSGGRKSFVSSHKCTDAPKHILWSALKPSSSPLTCGGVWFFSPPIE